MQAAGRALFHVSLRQWCGEYEMPLVSCFPSQPVFLYYRDYILGRLLFWSNTVWHCASSYYIVFTVNLFLATGREGPTELDADMVVCRIV